MTDDRAVRLALDLGRANLELRRLRDMREAITVELDRHQKHYQDDCFCTFCHLIRLVRNA